LPKLTFSFEKILTKENSILSQHNDSKMCGN